MTKQNLKSMKLIKTTLETVYLFQSAILIWPVLLHINTRDRVYFTNLQ